MAHALKNIKDAVGVLNSGGILLLQTDTLPGLHARADNASACSRIQELKGRGEKKPMVVLAANLDQALMVCGELSSEQKSVLHQCWPGPFSFILPAASSVCHVVTGGLGTVAVRVPTLDALRSLIESVGYPLASTSANLSGEPPMVTLSEAVSLFSGGVENYWLDDSWTESASGTQPSALIDLTGFPARVLREGPQPFPHP